MNNPMQLSPLSRSCPRFLQTLDATTVERRRKQLYEKKLRNAGELFNRLLDAVGLDRKEGCYVTNIVKCRPPGNRTPTEAEICNCNEVLRQEIQLIRPKVVFAVGGPAASTLLGRKVYITRENGKTYKQELYGVETIITPLLHPAYLLRQLGTDDETSIKRAMGDALRTGMKAAGLQPRERGS